MRNRKILPSGPQVNYPQGTANKSNSGQRITKESLQFERI